jgi:hypothetical protein
MNKDASIFYPSYQEQAQIVMDYLGASYNNFLLQAENSLKKHRNYTDSGPMELLSEVSFSIINKLDSSIHIEKFFSMVQSGKLSHFINKAIYTNSSSVQSPYLYKPKNRIPFNDELEVEDKETRTLDPEQEALLIKIDYILDHEEEAKRIFGKKNYRYYLKLINIYRQQPPEGLKTGVPSCYSKIEREYNLLNIAFHYRKIWKILKQELKKS